MTNEIIHHYPVPIYQHVIDDHEQDSVDARELYRYLGVRRDFSTWIKSRISEYQFTANLDYAEFSPNLGKTSFFGGRPKIEYHLSLDMAKELAMVERTAKGREIRRYFIEMERQNRLLDSISEQQRLERLNIPEFTRKLKNQVYELEEYIEALHDNYCKQRPDMLKLLTYRRMGLSHAECAKLLDCHRSSIGRRLKTLNQLGFRAEPQQLRLSFGGDV